MSRLLILFLIFSVYASEDVKLESVPQIHSPVIQKNRVQHTVDFVFLKCPKEYYVYYDSNKKKMVIDFYGVRINGPQLKQRESSLIGDLEIINTQTSMSLTGERSQIMFSLENGWHYEATTVSEKVLQLQFWRNLKPVEFKTKRKYNPLAPLIITAIGTGIISFAVFAFSSNN